MAASACSADAGRGSTNHRVTHGLVFLHVEEEEPLVEGSSLSALRCRQRE